jgi:hypothetical protein
MSRPKSRQVGTAGLVLRHRDGTCTRTCRRCGQFDTAPGWRAGLRAARTHAASHAAADARYVDTPWGVPTHDLPPARRQRPLRRAAAVVMVLALAMLAFGLTVANVTGHAAPAAPSIAVVPTTIKPAPTTKPMPHRPPTTEGYVPTPAGPPATDSGGTWLPEPDPTSTSQGAGGGC